MGIKNLTSFLLENCPEAITKIHLKELKGKNVIIEPKSPSKGLMVAFVEVNGAPIELMAYFE